MHTLTGKQFRNMVRGNGLTVAAVVKEAGVSASNINRWINDRHKITPTYDKLIAAYEKLKEKSDD